MRIAWFRPVERHGIDDDLAGVIDGLRAAHDVAVVTRDRAHDFVWQHARGMFDVCVYELANTPSHQFLWPYLLHYPGVLALRASSLHDSRAKALIWEHRTQHYEEEVAFGESSRRTGPPWHLARGGWPMWRIPVLASRITAVADPALAGAVRDACPQACVALIPAGVTAPPAHPPRATTAPVRVAIADVRDPALARRALDRSRAAGALFEVVADAAAADVTIATRWPLRGVPLTSALAGAAAGSAVVVVEAEATAGWPALDPQTWRPRAMASVVGSDVPVVVSIDPRDEEHSLMLAITRLAGDVELRRSLGAAARDWWARTGTVAHAVGAWGSVLDDARAVEPPPRPAGWPAHLDDDATGRARAILGAFGATTDLFY